MAYINPYRGKIYNRIVGGFLLITVIIISISGAYVNHKTKLVNLEYHFNGKVESVYYDIKGIATINIKGVHYILSDPNWDFDHNRISKGDSIIKSKNSMIVKLIKANGKIIVEGEN